MVEWVKAKNDPVSKGDIVVIVTSDKIEIEVESPADGLLLDITVPAGERGSGRNGDWVCGSSREKWLARILPKIT